VIPYDILRPGVRDSVCKHTNHVYDDFILHVHVVRAVTITCSSQVYYYDSVLTLTHPRIYVNTVPDKNIAEVTLGTRPI
jgi:hypothetical protein